MGTPTFYSWDDPGAPAWISNANGMGLYEVLKACLVNGYGAKSGAGWSVVYDDYATSGNFSITNAPQTGVLGLYHSKASGMQQYEPLLYVAEAMSTYDTPINGKSLATPITQTGFSYSYNASVHGVGSYKSTTSSSYSPRWIVVANENWAWVVFPASKAGHIAFNADPPTLGTAAWQNCPIIGFGAINSPLAVYGAGDTAQFGNFHIVGGKEGVDLGYPSSSLATFSCWTGLRDHEGMPTNRRYCHLQPFSMTSQCAGVLYENQLMQGILYSSDNSSLNINSVQLGRCPGIFGWRDLWRFDSSAHMALHHPGGFTYRDEITLDGRPFVYGVDGRTPIFISLEAADW